MFKYCVFSAIIFILNMFLMFLLGSSLWHGLRICQSNPTHKSVPIQNRTSRKLLFILILRSSTWKNLKKYAKTLKIINNLLTFVWIFPLIGHSRFDEEESLRHGWSHRWFSESESQWQQNQCLKLLRLYRFLLETTRRWDYQDHGCQRN